MLIKIEDVQIGDWVSVPLYLVENTRMMYPLFEVKDVEKHMQIDEDGVIKVTLRGNDGKTALMRAKGKLVQYRGRLREGVTYYKTGDRLPLGDLRRPCGAVMFDISDRLLLSISDVLNHFQFIEFVKQGINYQIYYTDHKSTSTVTMMYSFLHYEVEGQVHIRLDPEEIKEVFVLYGDKENVSEWKTDDIDEMKAMRLT